MRPLVRRVKSMHGLGSSCRTSGGNIPPQPTGVRIVEKTSMPFLGLVAILLGCFILMLASALAYPLQTGSQRLQLSVDYAQFRGDTSAAFVELYYSFSAGTLRLTKAEDNLSVAAILNVKVLELGTDSLIFEKRWKAQSAVRDTSTVERSRSLLGFLPMWLRPGKYTLRITGVDANDQANRDSLEFPILLRLFPSDSVSLSDLELCTSIKQTERSPSLSELLEQYRRHGGPISQKIPVGNPNSFFVKNTLEVIPNPSMLYSFASPIMYYYVELYNLKTRVEGGEYSYTVKVLDAAGHEVIGRNHTKRRIHDSSVEVGTISLARLESGTYTLRFSLNDSMTQQHATSSKKFFVYNPGITDSTAKTGGSIRGDYLSSEYALMDEETIDKEFQVVRYIALGDEMKRYESLTELNAKRKFMYEFWKRRDPDPTTLGNEVKKEYLGRVEHANLSFRGGLKDGWKTDRGRVYIVYGPPDEIERHPNEMDTKSYEIWYYHSIQGGVEFDFIDRSGFSDYILVNSTHRNEIRDDNWQQQLNAQ
jgi:GWxTD domain-containing protein